MLLEVEGLEASYGKVRVLHGVDLRAEEGSVVALLGANGAGKTTTLRSITGLQRGKRGSIRFDGQPIESRDPADIVRLGVSMVPERREIFAEMSVHENIELGAYTRRGREVTADLDSMYEMFPVLRERRSVAAGSLSGGQQQMLAIARALMARPRLLLLDEPSLGLAPVLVKEVFAKIREIIARGTSTVVIVEQNARLALALADYGYVLENGRVVFGDAADALLTDPRVQESYLGHV